MPERISSELEILLVEDNPDDRELTIKTLRAHGIANRIEVATTGADAIDFLFCEGAYVGRNIDQQPRVILLDLKLPLVSGVDVLRKVRAEPRLRKVPVVILTSSSEERDLTECYELGANSYIVKPVDFEQFSEAIRSLGMYWLLLNESPRGTGT
jgi:two-component system, response regulator